MEPALSKRDGFLPTMRITGQLSEASGLKQVPGPIEIPAYCFGCVGIRTEDHRDSKFGASAEQFRRWERLVHRAMKPAGIQFNRQIIFTDLNQQVYKALDHRRRRSVTVLLGQIQMTYHIKVIIIQH